MTKQKKRRAQTRQKILDAAAELFLKNGFENTSIAQIIERADVVKGTLYQHFQTKMDLLVVLSRESGAEQVRKLIEEVNQGTPALEGLRRYYFGMAQWFEANPKIAEDTIISAIRLHDPDSNIPEYVAHDFTKLMLKIGQKRGEVRKDISINIQAIVLGGAITLAVIDWHKKTNPLSLQELFQSCFTAYLQGVLPKELPESIARGGA